MNDTPNTRVVNSRLSLMMFLQFFVWGAWFTTLGLCLSTNALGNIIGDAYGSVPIGAIIAPLFLGLIADRFFSSQRVMGVLLIIGGIALCLVPNLSKKAVEPAEAVQQAQATYATVLQDTPGVQEAQQAVAAATDPETKKTAEEALAAVMGTEPIKSATTALEAAKKDLAKVTSPIIWLITLHMLCFMPTLALGNNIVFANVTDQMVFPKIRVWGTIGWIAAGLLIGFLGWSSNINIFLLGGGCALVLGVYCFTLPNTPAPAKGQKVDLRALLMVDALSLLTKPAFLVFILCSAAICVPAAYYFAYTSNFLGNTGFTQPASTMSMGQMLEIVFMLMIPFLVRRLGIKYMIIVGMLAWVARYLLFAFGASDQVVWMLFMGIIIHGICYDFFFVTGFMYTDSVSAKEIKGQAQSLLVFFTQGIGFFFGYKIAAAKFVPVVGKQAELQAAIDATRPEETLTFAQSLGRMFSIEKLTVDTSLIAETTALWKTFWIFPAILAAVVTVIFFAAFWDKTQVKEQEAPDK